MTRAGKGFISLAIGIAVFALATPCSAQVYIGRDAPRKGSVEISGGGNYQAGQDLSSAPANLTRNPTTGSGPLELFNADAELQAGFGIQARVGYYVTPAISIEGGLQVVRPKLEVRLTDDFEDASDVVATESITSYLFTGSVLYHLRAGKSLKPFIIGGAGHVRDLHQGDDVLETGLEYHAGGGIKSWFGTGRRKLGVRAEVLVSFRDGGVGTDDGRRTVPTAAFSIAYLF